MVSDSQKVTETIRYNICDRWKKAFCQVCRNLEENHGRRASSTLKGRAKGWFLSPLHAEVPRSAPRPPHWSAPLTDAWEGLWTVPPSVKRTIVWLSPMKSRVSQGVWRRKEEYRNLPPSQFPLAQGEVALETNSLNPAPKQ